MNAVAAPAVAGNAKTFSDMLNRPEWKAGLEQALKGRMTVENVLKIVVPVMNRNPKLFGCTVSSLYQAITECATTDLWPGPLAHAYLVERNNRVRGDNGQDRWERQAQFMIGYRGMMQLAYRSGEVIPGSFVAQPVYDRDEFEVVYGCESVLRHRPNFRGDRGPVIAWYAACRLTTEGQRLVFDVMTRDEILAIKARSSSKDRDGNVVGPWVSDENAMGCKTVIRRMWKLLPSSVTDKVADVVERDDERFYERSTPIDAVIPEAKPAAPRRLPEPDAAPVAAMTVAEVEATAEPEPAYVVPTGDERPGPEPVAAPAGAAAPAPVAKAISRADLKRELTAVKRLYPDRYDQAYEAVLEEFQYHAAADIPEAELGAFFGRLQEVVRGR